MNTRRQHELRERVNKSLGAAIALAKLAVDHYLTDDANNLQVAARLLGEASSAADYAASQALRLPPPEPGEGEG